MNFWCSRASRYNGGGQVLLPPREGRGGSVDGSALIFGNGEISRRARAWTLRLALTLAVGLVFTVWSSEDAHAVSKQKYYQVGSFCVGEQSSTYEASNEVLYGQSVTRPLAYSYYY